MDPRLFVGLPPLRLPGNPLRSEAAAFGWLLIVGGAILAITIVVLLVRAVV
ncbi:MAG TPA: hypothetical protein VGW75_07975 [Solirubrobacteraceae bacterium]|nr:hypothetical protein [Solirubrobacteraceae bacterium]